MSEKAHVALMDMLLPRTGDISSMVKFSDMCQKILNTIKNMIYPNGLDIERTLNFGTHKRIPNKRNTIPTNMMQITGDIRNATEAVSNNSVFVEVDGEELVFFTLVEQPRSASVGTAEIRIEDTRYADNGAQSLRLGDDSYTYDSSGNIVGKRNAYLRRDIGRGREGQKKAASVSYYSETKEVYDSETTGDHSDPLDYINGSISSFGGTTFNYLLSSTMASTDTEINACGEVSEQDIVVTQEIENTILDSIITSPGRDEFVNRVNEIYQEHYFRKESLGDLYDFVMKLLSSRKVLKKADETYKKQKKNKTKRTDYKETVKSGQTTGQKRSQTAEKLKRDLDDDAMFEISKEVMTARGEWVPESEQPEDALSIVRTVVVDHMSDSHRIVVSNNVAVATPTVVDVTTAGTPSTSRPTRGGIPARLAPSTSSRAGSPSGGSTSGGSTSGGSTSGGGGGSSY